MIALAEHFLRGSYPPLITPFRDYAVDYDAFAALVRRQIAEGSHGIVVNGTTAEPTTLSTAERIELVRLAVRSANGRIPVVAATGSQSHAETIELTIAAGEAGAAAALVVTPYFIRPPRRGLVEYYVDIALYWIPCKGTIAIRAAVLRSCTTTRRGCAIARRGSSRRTC